MGKLKPGPGTNLAMTRSSCRLELALSLLVFPLHQAGSDYWFPYRRKQKVTPSQYLAEKCERQSYVAHMKPRLLLSLKKI